MANEQPTWWKATAHGKKVLFTAHDQDDAEMAAQPALKAVIGHGRFIAKVSPATVDDLDAAGFFKNEKK